MKDANNYILNICVLTLHVQLCDGFTEQGKLTFQLI